MNLAETFDTHIKAETPEIKITYAGDPNAMNRLSDKQYDKQKLAELRKRQQQGDLTKEMEPYLDYLEGRRRFTPSIWHTKAHKLLQELNACKAGNYKKVAEQVTHTTNVIQSLYAGQFREVGTETAQSLYYELKEISQ